LKAYIYTVDCSKTGGCAEGMHSAGLVRPSIFGLGIESR